MYYTNEERRVLAFLKIDEGRSLRKTAERFHQLFPARPIPSPKTITALVAKLRGTGSVVTRPKSGRPRSATDEEHEVMVLGSVYNTMQQSIREISIETGMSQTSVGRILHRYKFHPYGVFLTQKLSEKDFEKRMDFCEEMDQKMRDPDFLRHVCFSDESTFHLTGYVNRHNCRYWSQENPHIISEAHTQVRQKLNVWAGILGNRLVGPFFIEGNLNGELYLEMLQKLIVPAMRVAAAAQNMVWENVIFQQDGAPAHYKREVTDYLNATFPNRWIGRNGPIRWPPRSPDLTPLDFFLWGFLKDRVFRIGFPRDLNEMYLRILEYCSEPDDEMFERVMESFAQRIYLCIHENGRHFEHLL